MRLLTALAGLLLAVPIAGSSPAAQPAQQQGASQPLLWKVSDADSTVYLLGSFHLLKKSDYPLSGDVERAVADAERFVFEVSPEQLSDPMLPARMAQRAMFQNGATLSRTLPGDLNARVQAKLASLGLPAAQFDVFEPWFVNITLVTTFAQRTGFSPEEGLDRHLMARAASLGRATGGLETLDAQLDAIDGTPMAEQIASLGESVDENEDLAGKLDELHRAWREGDLATLDRIARLEMLETAPESYRRLNVERNRAWLPQIEALLARGAGEDALVVVGALHLLGEDGLVALLQARGLDVERVCSTCEAGGRAAAAAP